MPTPVFITDWSHGVTPSTAGGGLASSITGTPTVVAAPAGLSGSYALECNPSASAERWEKNYTADVHVNRFYVRVSSLPTVDAYFGGVRCTTGNYPFLGFNSATGKLAMRFGTSGAWTDSVTLVVNTWYQIDMRAIINTNPRTLDWQVDGAAQTQVSQAATASNTIGIRLGTQLASETWTAQFKRLIISNTSADYPIGDGEVVAPSPNADGTHSPATPDCIRGGGASPALISGSNLAYQYMDDVPFPSGASPTTDRINQDIATSHVDHYVEMAFADLAGSSTVNGVIGLLAYGGDATQANNGGTVVVRNDATQVNIYGGAGAPADMSESTVFYKSTVVTAPGGGWTEAEVNALLMRIGYSTDITPNPYWQALMLEVDYVAGAGGRSSKNIRDHAMGHVLHSSEGFGRRIGGAKLFSLWEKMKNEIAALGKKRKLWTVPKYIGVGSLRRESRS